MGNEAKTAELVERDIMRILFIEDNPDDLDLAFRALRKAKIEFVPDVVKTREEFIERLLLAPHDVVVSDYRLPGWTGMDALRLMRENGQCLPFVLLTGVLGEEVAVDCIKQGASDYVLKANPTRLPIAIIRAVNEKSLTEQRFKADQRLRESEDMFRSLAETIQSAILVYVGTKCRYANPEAEVITGYTRDELTSMDSLNLIHADSRGEVIRMGSAGGSIEALPQHHEVKIVTRSGGIKWLDMTSSIVDIERKRGRLVTAVDITERKKEDEEIRRLITVDPLTGLANYRRLVDAFDSELGRSSRTGRPFSIILLDLDELKKINDAHGHVAGSRAICRVGNVLRAQCRSLDIAARYGGDEFAVILPETCVHDAKHLASRIASAVRRDGEQPSISVSFGLAECPDNGSSFKEVLRVADGGLYLMKGKHFQETHHLEYTT